jgi:hypothetical protein
MTVLLWDGLNNPLGVYLYFPKGKMVIEIAMNNIEMK